MDDSIGVVESAAAAHERMAATWLPPRYGGATRFSLAPSEPHQIESQFANDFALSAFAERGAITPE